MDKKELKEKYKTLFAIVKEAVDEWDPYGLLKMGAPKDEFESEVAQICPLVAKSGDADELAKHIKHVFDTMFEPIFKIDECKKVAEKILRDAHEAKI